MLASFSSAPAGLMRDLTVGEFNMRAQIKVYVLDSEGKRQIQIAGFHRHC